MLKSKFQMQQRHRNSKILEKSLKNCICILPMQKLFQKTINPEATEKKTGKSDYLKLKNL